jgi:hypothetical protein
MPQDKTRDRSLEFKEASRRQRPTSATESVSLFPRNTGREGGSRVCVKGEVGEETEKEERNERTPQHRIRNSGGWRSL